MTEKYVELHACSAFSFLEGASLPEELVSRAGELEFTAIGLLDRDGVYGAPRMHIAARNLGIRAHIGAEITAVDGTRWPLLAECREGYQNLCRLITKTKLRSRKGEGLAAYEDIAAHAKGLVCLTGGDNGPLAVALNGGIEAGLRRAEWILQAFGRNQVYAEIQRHLDRSEEALNQGVIEIARRHKLPLICTNGVRYAVPARRELHDALTCLRHKVRLQTAGRLLSKNSERYLKSARAMSRLFSDLPEAIASTTELSSRLDFTLADLGYQFPPYPIPEGETMISFLRKRTEEGARLRYRTPATLERARRQLERELALIEKLGLAGYFLIVWDIVNFCRDNGILVQGRGSAANSAVCYSLGITAVDPVGMDLLFERFLSEERGEWPDIDLDLPSGNQRERAIQYVYERYGKLGAAMTANVITYRGRSAAREMGKVLGFEDEALSRLSSLIRAWEWEDPKETVERQFRDAGLDITDPRIARFLRLFSAVQDLPRHLGQHSGGMVICQGQLDSIVPLEPASMPGRVVVQWDKEDCADMGILKVDLLGLGMMAVLEDTIELISREYREEVDLAHLPQDDPEVYAALQRADTIGMFQVESRAQMACLPRLCPKKFYDIVVQVAIIRPGPIVGKMVHPYLNRRLGRESPDCLHPLLEPVLGRTLGVPLFQEQLLRMAMICAGFSGAQSEELRRAFGFKRSEARMREVELKLRSGMNSNGITGPVQDRIVESITSFALYGFPESHAASFALLAYASAWLKCHYAAAFTASLLNNQPMGFYHPATIIKDAQRHGVRIRPVDVSLSNWDCTVEEVNREKCIRLGLRFVKGLRQEAALSIIREREKRRFTSIDDVALRVSDLRKDELVKLAQSGALNFLQPGSKRHRRDALWNIESAARTPGPLLARIAEISPSPLKPMTADERMHADFSATGVTLGPHPMLLRRGKLQENGVLRAADLQDIGNGEWVAFAGYVIARQRPGTAKGFVFLSLEDETGIGNIIVNPDLFEQNRVLLVSEPALLIEGTLQNQDRVISIKAQRIKPLSGGIDGLSHDFH